MNWNPYQPNGMPPRPMFNAQPSQGFPPMQAPMPNALTGSGYAPMPAGIQAHTGGGFAPRPMMPPQGVQASGGLPPQHMGLLWQLANREHPAMRRQRPGLFGIVP